MKKLVLGILLILLSPFVFAEVQEETTSNISTFSVIGVYDNGPASDEILVSKIILSLQLMKNDDGSLKYGDIPSTYAKLFSKIDINNIDNRVTLLVYNGEAVIIVGSHSPSSHLIFANELINILNEKNIKYRRLVSDDVNAKNLIDLFSSETSTTCTDSDGWDKYYEKGYVIEKGITHGDTCWSGLLYSGEAVESGPGVAEYACYTGENGGAVDYSKYVNSGGWMTFGVYQCPNGCKDGACVKETKNNYSVLHRIVKNCATKEPTTGEQLIYLDIFKGGSYGNYGCESRYDEQCILDGSFDTYYEEWCDYTDKNVCGETGFCVKENSSTNSQEKIDTQNLLIADNQEQGNKNNEEILESSVNCGGCLDSNNNCVPVGIRTENEFCDIDKVLKTQLTESMQCNNNFECDSNVCVNNKCISKGLLEKVLSWFMNLFG